MATFRACKRLQLACEERGGLGRLVMLRERQEPRLLGADECIRCLPEAEVDEEHRKPLKGEPSSTCRGSCTSREKTIPPGIASTTHALLL